MTRFQDVRYDYDGALSTEELAQAYARQRERERLQDTPYADGQSLEIGSDAYQAMVMDAHGLDEHDQADVRRGYVNWQQGVDAVSRATPDEQEQEYRETLQQDAQQMVDAVATDDTYVMDDQQREQYERQAKRAESLMLAQMLEDVAQTLPGSYDNAVAEHAARMLDDAVTKQTVDVDDMQAMAASTVETMQETSEQQMADEQLSHKTDDYEFGF